MEFKVQDLDRLTVGRIDIDEPLSFDLSNLDLHSRLIALRDIFAVGHGYFDSHSSQFITDLRVDGIMSVPCAISLKPFDIEFSIQYGEVFSFEPVGAEEEGIEEVEGDTLDLKPYLLAAILAEVPLKAIDPNLEDYPEGDGWIVMTEEDYIKEKNQEIDPRLAKLKDFKFE